MTSESIPARERLIDAAAQELWLSGYSATSPADIQRAAKAGQGSMYHHFKDKATLARAAIERLAASLSVENDDLLDRDSAGLERVLAYLERDRDPFRGCRIGRLTADQEVIDQPLLREPLAESFRQLQDQLIAAIGDAQRTGDLAPSLDRRALAAMIVAVVQGGFVLARAEQDEEAFRRVIDGARSLLAAAAPRPTKARRRAGR